jgi:hypothetical protein
MNGELERIWRKRVWPNGVLSGHLPEGTAADIRTEHLSNTSLERYRCANLFRRRLTDWLVMQHSRRACYITPQLVRRIECSFRTLSSTVLVCAPHVGHGGCVVCVPCIYLWTIKFFPYPTAFQNNLFRQNNTTVNTHKWPRAKTDNARDDAARLTDL